MIRKPAPRSALIALGTVLGLQSLRALLPLLVFVMRDRWGLSSVTLGVVALALFCTSFPLPRIARATRGRLLGGAALVLAIARAALQLWPGDPAGSLVFAAMGTVAFLALLAGLSGGRADGSGEDGPAFPLVPVLLGGLIDTVLHAAAGTRDLHWGGALPSVVALALCAAVAGLAMRRPPDATNLRAARPAGLLAWGPYWLLQLELLGNVARFSARTGLPTAHSGALAALGLALAVVAADRAGSAAPGTASRRARVLAAAAALVVGLVGHDTGGWVALPLLVAAQVGAAVLLACAIAPAPAAPGSGEHVAPAPGGSVAYGAGFVLFLVGLFAHYVGYDVPLPVSALGVQLGVGAALVVAALVASRRRAAGPRPGAPRPPRRGLAVGAATVALVPLLHGVPRMPHETSPAPDRLRVVSFNVHNGFDERGTFAFDRMMDSLRACAPDVVALQEVNRGWVIHGSTDLLELAREALGLQATFGPSTATDWGNAILSRAPPESSLTTPLPPLDLLLPRAVIRARVPLAGRAALTVLATHYHHRESDPGIRVEHSRFLADRFPPDDHAVLLGDFNDLPGSECLRILRDAGWADVAASAAGPDAEATYPSASPQRRIDTILHGPGLLVRQTRVEPPWGSDHRAVVADFELR